MVNIEVTPPNQTSVSIGSVAVLPIVLIEPDAETVLSVSDSSTAQPDYEVSAGAIALVTIEVEAQPTARIEDQDLDGIAAQPTIAGQPLYLMPDTKFGLAQANSPTTADVRAFASSPATMAGQTIAIARDGWVERSDWTAIAGTVHLIPGATYYLGTDAPGTITATPPETSGLISAEVGFAVNDRRLALEFQSYVFL
jgi:hypothetical protein